MPIEKRNGKYYYGSKGPYPTRDKALEVSRAIYANKGRKKSSHKPKPKPKTKPRGKHMPKKR